jgi:hypothetical protein
MSDWIVYITVVVFQELHRVDQYVRQNDTQWLLTEFHTAEDIIKLSSINCELALKEIVIGTEPETQKPNLTSVCKSVLAPVKSCRSRLLIHPRNRSIFT